MRTWQKCFAGLAVVAGVVNSGAAQQFPGIPSPTPVPPAPVPVAAAPAAAPQQTLWSWLGCSKEQKEQCRQRLCQTQLGLLLSNGMAPVGMFSGGIIPPLCPGLPTAAELNSSNPAVAAAAQIKKDEAEAKARRAAVRYLSTVSCHYWPETEDALIAALMFDRNECVRWEAAMALGTGCCCTKKTIEALAITASGSKKKRDFTETSERVKGAAEAALYHCLDCYHEIVPAPESEEKPREEPARKPEEPVAAVPRHSNIHLAAFYAEVEGKPMADVLDNARKVLQNCGTRQPGMTSNFTTGNRNVFQIASNSMQFGARKVNVFGKERGGLATPAAQPEPESSMNFLQVLRNRREARETGVPATVEAAIAREQAAKPTAITPASNTDPASVPASTKPLPIASTPPPAAGKSEASATTGKTVQQVTGSEPPLAGSERKIANPSTLKAPTAPDAVPEQQSWSPKKSAHQLFERVTKSKTAPKPEPTPVENSMSASVIKPVVYVTSHTPATPASPNVIMNREATTAAKAATITAHASAASSPYPLLEGEGRVRAAAPKPAAQVRPTAVVAHQVESPAQPNRERGMPSVAGLLIIFQDSPESPQRQWAVQMLGRHDWAAHPEVIPSLLAGAQKDSDRAVRVQCIRCLTARHVNTPAVLAALRDLQKDTDARVQQEATEGLGRLHNQVNQR